MPSDTGKENASVVDTTVSERKYESGNMDEPGSPSYRVNEDSCRSRAEEHTNSCQQIGISNENGNYGIRYFIIKSLSHENIQLSVNNGIWATQVVNEPILDEAFHNSCKVILIFSVNMSGCFQGYAQMISSVGWRRDRVWCEGNGGRNPWGRSFKVKWLRLSDLPFQRTLHLKNPWNQYKPVKISRDCQELPADIGEALCELLDGQETLDVSLKMDRRFARNDEEDSLLFYPPLRYQQNQVDVSRRIFAAEESKQSSFANLHAVGPPVNMLWSPPASNLTEDDFLDMTYEEYLEAHNRGSKRSPHPVSGPSQSTQRSFVSEENCDDSQSGCSSKKRRS